MIANNQHKESKNTVKSDQNSTYSPQYQQSQPYQQYPPQYQQNQPYPQQYQMNQAVISGLCCEKCGSNNVDIKPTSEKNNIVGFIMFMVVIAMILLIVLFLFGLFLADVIMLGLIMLIAIILLSVLYVRKNKMTTTYVVCRNCGHSYKIK